MTMAMSLQAACLFWLLSQPVQADGQMRGLGESAVERAHPHLCQHRSASLLSKSSSKHDDAVHNVITAML